jgi:transcriptional regulator with PAS, ATPase and Fis domain
MKMPCDAKNQVARWDYTLDDFKSADPVMNMCLRLADLASRTDLPTLILGESGTGKTLLARAIHNSSRRAQSPFVAFNAAALSETLLDSQLFGHEKGAFTGAEQQVKGKFELAHGGTLFVDEIADMSTVAQAKILRAIEYGEFERLGSEKLQRADVRLISATHLPLSKFIVADRFRKDLFYRISGLTITIPPLRDRPNDLRSLIAAEILSASRSQGKTITGLDTKAAQLLFSYHWPGNLRELKRVIEAAVALSHSDVIPVDAVMLEKVEASPTADSRVSAHPPESNGDRLLKTAERRHIQRVLTEMTGNKRQTARVLGISRATLDRKLSSL